MDFDWSSFFKVYELSDEFLISKNNDIWVNKSSDYYPTLKLPEDIRKFYENTDRKEYKSLFYYFLHHVKGEETANVIHLYPIEPEEPVKPLLQEAEDGYYKDVKKIDFILSIFNIIIIIFRFIKLAVIGALSSAMIIGVIWSIIDSSIEVPSKEFYTGLFLGIFFLLVGIFVICSVIASWSKLNPYYIEKRKYIEYSYADKCFIQYKNNNKYQNDLIEYNKKKAEYDKLKKDIETQKTNYQRQKLLVKNNIDSILKKIWIEKCTTKIYGQRVDISSNKGESENLLFCELMKIFPNFVKIDMKVSNHYPDILLNLNSKHYLDIEIDEPYDLINKKEMNYIDCYDVAHHDSITNLNCFILRFSERQILNNTKECVQIIKNLVNFILSESSIFDFYNSEEYKAIVHKKWTKEEARMMLLSEVRENKYKEFQN